MLCSFSGTAAMDFSADNTYPSPIIDFPFRTLKMLGATARPQKQVPAEHKL